MSKKEEKKFHCELCREIEEGCEAERASGKVPVCAVCGTNGYIDLGNGSAVACNSCARGYRMKLWLRHEGRQNGYPDGSGIRVA